MFELPTVHLETETGGLEDPLGPAVSGPIDGGMPDRPTPVTPKSQAPGDVPAVEDTTGTCVTATCISFVTLGYCIVAISLAVAYRKYKPRDRSKQFDLAQDDDTSYDEQTEVLNPVFEQHNVQPRGGGLAGSVRGFT